MGFYGIGLWEFLFILIVFLLVFGPARLVEISRALGRGIRWLRDASSNLSREISKELSDIEAKERVEKKDKG